ncbi:MAG TPA: AraC family transcriptional regulator [Burkholderiaceae bacterium]
MSPEPRGVLHRLAAGEFAHGRLEAPDDLADRVEHFWTVRWNLEGRPARVQETLPHPNVHLVAEPGSIAAWGVHTGRWTRVLEGRSQAFGIKFRPGAFRAPLGRAVSTIADASIAATEVFGPDAVLLANVLGHDDDRAAADIASAFLRERLPAADGHALLAGRIVDSAADDLELHSADELARRFGMTLRALQRLFNEFVGVGPKWVINRYRMHEAVARVQAGEPVSWAALAQDLGYFDQAHFIADFRRLVGRTPGDYARALHPR